MLSNTTNTTTEEELFAPWSLALLYIYSVIVILLGVVGNGIVLIGSIKYNALEIDKVSLIFIQNLAFFDIWTAINFYLPRFISLIAGEWVLGDVLCHITGSLNTFPIYSEVSIVLLITFYRLYTLKDPLNMSLTALHAKIIIVIVWIFNSWYVVALLIQGVRPYYNAAEFGCITLNVDDYTINICNTVATFLNVVVPMFVIILGNVAILIIAAKIAKNWGKGPEKLCLQFPSFAGLLLVR